ncbi:hypothetical protein P8452_53617 [Trifolium repens]|nr:hypothetical protein P8452_53617 [Trifolium repens]
MDKASDKPKFCVGDDNRREHVYCECFESDDDDDDDVPLSQKMPWISSLGVCSSKFDASVKRDTTTRPVKRVFDNNSLCGSMKKSMVSPTPYDHNDNDNDDDNDDVPLSKRLSRLSSLGTCSTKRDSSVKKSDTTTTTVAVKRLFDNSKFLCGSMKKPKVSPTPYDDDNDEYDDDDVPISSIIKMPAMSTDKSFSSLKKELALVENSFEECKRKRQEEEKRLKSITKEIEKFSEELRNKKTQVSCVRKINEIHKKMKGKIEECVKDFLAKEGQLHLMEVLIGERKQELCQVMDNISKWKHFETEVKEFESKEKRFERKVKETVKDLVSMLAHFDWQVKEFESNKKEHEGQVKDHESKVREFDTQMKEWESKKKHFESQVEKLKSKKRHFRGHAEEHESKEKQLDGRVKEFKSKKDKFEGRVKELESGNEHFERRLKDLESKEKQFEVQVKEFQPKAEEFNGLVKEFESKEQFKGQVKKFKLKRKQFESQVEDNFNVPVKEHKLKEIKFDRQIKDPESKLIKLDKEKEFITSYMDNELSPTVDDGTSLQLFPSEQTDILVNLLESSDPAKVVLDIIQNPIISLCKNIDNGVIIDNRHIYLLEQLMKISPDIKPCVREEALKLALHLKANMKENNENSLVVLGFLLLLSIYGLVSYFNEDYILEIFAFVAQHKIAVKLFEALGFANKLSDFVEKLIRMKQFDSVLHITWLRRINKFLC